MHTAPTHWTAWNAALASVAAELDAEVRKRLVSSPPAGVSREALATPLVTVDDLHRLCMSARPHLGPPNQADRAESRVYQRMTELRGPPDLRRRPFQPPFNSSGDNDTPGEFSRWRIGTAVGTVYRTVAELEQNPPPRDRYGRVEGGVLVLNENRADLSASKLLTEFANRVLFMAGPIDATGLQAVADAAAPWVPALVERGARLVVPAHYGHLTIWRNVEDELEGLGLVTQFGLTPGLVLPDHGVASDESLLAWVDEVFEHGAMFNAHLFIGNSPRWVNVAHHFRKTKPGTTVTHWERKELDAAEHEKAWFWTGEE
jgi:hypothetical protein